MVHNSVQIEEVDLAYRFLSVHALQEESRKTAIGLYTCIVSGTQSPLPTTPVNSTFQPCATTPPPFSVTINSKCSTARAMPFRMSYCNRKNPSTEPKNIKRNHIFTSKSPVSSTIPTQSLLHNFWRYSLGFHTTDTDRAYFPYLQYWAITPPIAVTRVAAGGQMDCFFLC